MFKSIFTIILDLLFPPRCLICRKVGEEAFCSECLSKIKYIKSEDKELISIAEYGGNIKRAIKLLKFKNKKVLAKPLAEICLGYLDSQKVDLIIPVPLHPKRFRSRGFNQCFLIGKVISDKTNIPIFDDILYRIKNTKAQFSLKKEERPKNVGDAFGVRERGKAKGKRVLLLDDIYTTGATVRECSRVLKAAGAADVHILTLCRVL